MKKNISFKIGLLFFVFTLLLSTGNTFAQCTANAGNDTVFCMGGCVLPDLFLGGNPTATGGTTPYSYCWETTYQVGNLTFTASDFLDDTTIANPQFLGGGENNDIIPFILTVTDSLGNTCKDTINIRISKFAVLTGDFYISQGDTVQLYPGVYGGIPPLSFQWSPNYNLSCDTIENPLAWPDSSVSYYVGIIDSVGCSPDPVFANVTVYPTNISTQSHPVKDIVVFPNPAKNYLRGLLIISSHQDFQSFL